MISEPGEGKSIDYKGSVPAVEHSMGQESYLNDCLNNGDYYEASDEADPYVVFDCGDDVKAFTMNFDPDKTDGVIYLYYDCGRGFNEEDTVEIEVSKDIDYIFGQIGKNIRQIRFDFHKTLKIDGIKLYNELKVDGGEPVSRGGYPQPVIVISLLLAAAVTYAQWKTKALEKLFFAVKNNIRSILVFSGGLLLCALLSLAVTRCLCAFRGQSFNIYLFVFILAAFAVVFELFFFSKAVPLKTERLFLAVCLTLGMMMVLTAPVGRVSWDDGVHYRYALSTTAPETVYTEADSIVMTTGVGSCYEDDLAANIARYQYLNYQDGFTGGKLGFDLNIPHFFPGVAVKLAKYFGFSFVQAFVFGKIPVLLIYAFVCYFAIKRLRSGKMILSVIALFPTAMLVATNYSHDYWVIAFSFLGFAYYYSELQQPNDPISKRDTRIMFGALFLACIPKAIYLTVLLLPLFMPKKKIPDRKRYCLTCIVAFVLLAAIIFINAKLRVEVGGDSRGGEFVNPGLQLSYILSHPFSYAGILAKFLFKYFSPDTAKEYISALAMGGLGESGTLLLCLLTVVTVIDKNEYDAATSKLKHKAVPIALLIVTAALIATVLYIDYTPVGLDTINGCQARYLLPVILPLCLTVASIGQPIRLTDKQKRLTAATVFAISSYGLLSDYFTTFLTKMM